MVSMHLHHPLLSFCLCQTCLLLQWNYSQDLHDLYEAFFFFLFCGNWLIALICLSCPCSRQTSVSPEFKQRLQCKDLLSLRWCWKFVSWWSLCMGNAIDTNTGKFLATANYKCILATVSPSSYFLFFPLFFLCFLQTAPATAVCVTGEYNTTVTTVGDPSMIF